MANVVKANQVEGNVERPEEMSAEDEKDPQNMSNNNCITYLEFIIPKFDQKMKDAIASGTRPDARIKQLWMECQKRRNVIMLAC